MQTRTDVGNMEVSQMGQHILKAKCSQNVVGFLLNSRMRPVPKLRVMLRSGKPRDPLFTKLIDA